MKLPGLIIGIIAISMVILGAVQYLGSLEDSYGENVDLSGLNNTQSRLEEQQANAQSLSDEVNDFKLENPADFISIPYKMIQVGWKVGKTIFGSWATIGTMVTETGNEFSDQGIPLPGWLIPSIISIIIVMIVSIMLYALFKWKFED